MSQTELITPLPDLCDRYSAALFPTVDTYNERITAANDLLLHRQLVECLALCAEQAGVARNFTEDKT